MTGASGEDDPLALHERGLELFDVGEWEAALASFEASLAARSRDPEARLDWTELASTLHMVARVREKRGELAAALAGYEEARAADERSPKVRNRRARAMTLAAIGRVSGELLDWKRAATAFEAAVGEAQHLPEDRGLATVLFALARARRRLGGTRAALAVLRAARAMAERLHATHEEPYATILHAIGDCHRELGEWAKAARAFEAASRVSARPPESRALTLAWLGRCRGALGEWKASVAAFRVAVQALEPVPRSPTSLHASVLEDLAVALEEAGDAAGAACVPPA